MKNKKILHFFINCKKGKGNEYMDIVLKDFIIDNNFIIRRSQKSDLAWWVSFIPGICLRGNRSV